MKHPAPILASIAICMVAFTGTTNAQDKDSKRDIEKAVDAIREVQQDIDNLKKEGAAWTKVRASLKQEQVQTLDRMMKVSKEARSSKVARRLEGFRKKAKACEAPMLSPRKALLAADSKMVSLKNSYSMQGTSDTGPIAINGTCKTAKGPGVNKLRKRAQAQRKKAMPKLAKLNASYNVIKTEYGKEMTFSKYGCAYTITSICSAATTPCPSDSEMANMAADIILVNGD